MNLSMLHCEGERIINTEGKQVFLHTGFCNII